MGRERNIGGGRSQRQLRVGELIRRTLSDLLARGDLGDPDLENVSITVGEVRTSPDLRVATVFVMPLGGQDVDTVIEALTRNRREIRHNLTKSVHLKYSPDLKFMADQTFDQMDKARSLLEDERVRRDVEGGTGSDTETGT